LNRCSIKLQSNEFMPAPDLKSRVAELETQVAEIRSMIVGDPSAPKNWRRAVERYAGDTDLLAVLGEAKKLRDAERKKVQRRRTHRPKA
jgi:hypothetical protein